MWTNLAKFINNLCLSQNEDVRARYVSSNWIQSPKKKNKGKKKREKEKKEMKLGVDPNEGRRECEMCE